MLSFGAKGRKRVVQQLERVSPLVRIVYFVFSSYRFMSLVSVVFSGRAHTADALGPRRQLQHPAARTRVVQ